MTTETLEEWEARARLALAARGVDKEVADARLSEVTQHCGESGQSPEQDFGAPRDFAETVAADSGTKDAGEDEVWLLPGCGLLAVGFGAFLWIFEGLLVRTHLAGLVGTVLLYAMSCCVLLVERLATAGRPRAVPWVVGGIPVLMLLAAAAGELLPRRELFVLPAPVLVVLGSALVVWSLWRGGRHTEPQGSGEDAAQWLRDLSGLLEGRHNLSRARAAELVSEAAAHLAGSGRAPLEEFGPVEEYARQLAEHQPTRPPWWRREGVQRRINVSMTVLVLSVNLAEDGPLWLSGVAALALCLALWTYLTERSAPQGG